MGDVMTYPVAEKFKSVQGEGLYTGTPMAFVRLVGCNVGQGVCKLCDTDFDRMDESLGGGLFTAEQLNQWVGNYEHVCFTGGEPLTRDLEHIIQHMVVTGREVHIETSGTIYPPWLFHQPVWLCVSPKPGWKWQMVQVANEIKVIYGGLGLEPNAPGWPTLEQAVKWASLHGKLVYLQPRNTREHVHQEELEAVLEAVARHPVLRVSTQLHKFLRVR